MFQVGDLITGKQEDRRYGITTEMSLCRVVEVAPNDIRVELIAHVYSELSDIFWVEPQHFEHCTWEQFLERYPNANIFEDNKQNEIKYNKKEIKTMELRMNKTELGNYVLTTEERETLRTEIMNLLEEYDYNPTEEAVDKILNEWVKNKGWMVNLFKKHPNYNGKFQIAFDTDYTRCTDKRALETFVEWMLYVAEPFLKVPVQKGVFSYEEVRETVSKLKEIITTMNDIRRHGYFVAVNGREYEEILAEKDKWQEKYNAYRTDESLYIVGRIAYDKAKYQLYNILYHFRNCLSSYTDHIATEEFAAKVNEYFPNVKAVAGQKVSRIVNKLCKLIEVDKHPDYNREFAKYSDAINPLAIKRHTILSCHPVDYLTMSFGNSWASCHTIDKQNKRGMPNDYSGCYSSGTLSYMLDESSFVYYTVDKSYEGNEYELQDKINRNMFHMGEDKLIQARVYPQATDGDSGIYKQIREIAQKVVADCLGVPNMWKNVKGTGECSDMIHSCGTHYTDYTNFSDCNVSYLKGETGDVNRNKIYIGHDPICPNCGRTHRYQEAIECERCYEGRKECSCCGCTGDSEDMHYIDGDWYCNECSFYCEYHECWETGDDTYVENYGRVCEDALDDGDFYYCDHCENYFYRASRYDTHIVAEDGTDFCGISCAERAGYVELDGEWYHEDDVYYCEHCNTTVHRDNWNDELDCCEDCEDEVREEMETTIDSEGTEEVEEREAV